LPTAYLDAGARPLPIHDEPTVHAPRGAYFALWSFATKAGNPITGLTALFYLLSALALRRLHFTRRHLAEAQPRVGRG